MIGLCSAQTRDISFKLACLDTLPSSPKLFILHFPLRSLPEDPSNYRGEWGKVFINSRGFGKEFKVKLSHPALPLFTNPDPTSKPIAVAKIPTNIDECLIVLAPDAPNNRYLSFPISTKNIPTGSMHVNNLTKHSILLSVGQKKVRIPSHKHYTFKLAPGAYPTQIFRATHQDKKLEHTSHWVLRENIRELVFFYGEPMRWKHLAEHSKR